MTRPLRVMRPARGVTIGASHAQGVVNLAIAGHIHQIDADTAYSLMDQISDAADAALEHWKTRPRYKAPDKPAPEAQ